MTHAGFYVAAHCKGSDQRLRFQISFSQPESAPPEEIRKASGAVTWGICVSINRLNRKQQNVYGQIEKVELKFKKNTAKGGEQRHPRVEI